MSQFFQLDKLVVEGGRAVRTLSEIIMVRLANKSSRANILAIRKTD